MSIPDDHPDGTTPGILLPGHSKKVPWLKPTPLKGMYTTEPGEAPHWLAVAKDGRRVLFSKLADYEHVFALFVVRDFNFTHADYVKLNALALIRKVTK